MMERRITWEFEGGAMVRITINGHFADLGEALDMVETLVQMKRDEMRRRRKRDAPPEAQKVDLTSDSPQSQGGRARAEALTPEARSEIAKNAANARWYQPGDALAKTINS